MSCTILDLKFREYAYLTEALASVGDPTANRRYRQSLQQMLNIKLAQFLLAGCKTLQIVSRWSMRLFCLLIGSMIALRLFTRLQRI